MRIPLTQNGQMIQSDNEAEVLTLIDQGWMPLREDGSPFVVSILDNGTVLLDNRTIHAILYGDTQTIPWWGWVGLLWIGKRFFL